MNITEAAKAAKKASIYASAVNTETKNAALEAIKASLQANKDGIFAANAEDIERAEQENLEAPLLKRLKFDESKLAGVCEGIDTLIRLNDPVGKTLAATELDDGLELYKVSCPIGVIGVIFESRPDALVQISTLCLKSSNAVLLKGGSEAAKTNRVLADIIIEASEKAGMPWNWMGLLESREDVAEMLKCDEYIDLLIPRGSNEFVKYIMDNTNIAVLGHADGICHVYIDSEADVDMAVKIAVDSKCQYCAVCNAAETVLVHKDIAQNVLRDLVVMNFKQLNVEVRGCEKTQKYVDVIGASEADWGTEYLDKVVSIKVVDSLEEAIEHINKYGSGHTDVIVSNDKVSAGEFMDLVDSADVFWNCSSRFSDGFRYGFGAEVGISTNKIHARGPVGLEGLLIYKYKMVGSGQIVTDYASGEKKFSHKKLNKEFEI